MEWQDGTDGRLCDDRVMRQLTRGPRVAQIAGTYTVTVALTGYITQTFTGIVVTQGMSTALIPTQIVMIR